ncbi:MAG TPA: Xaa-Pro peptidase family protein, partial [Lysobacter sp.]
MRRRDFLSAAVAASGALMLPGGLALAAPAGVTGLTSLTVGTKPISPEERMARIAKLQRLMVEQQIGALIVESGSSLDYFTGVQWHRSERTTAAVIPARGDVVIVTPAFEEPSIRETLAVSGDVRPWNEHESPFDLIVGALRDRGVKSGSIAFESTTRLFIVDGVREASAGAYRIVSGDALVKAVRLIKSPAELALMQAANNVTLAALRYVHDNVRIGMRPEELGAMIDAATAALGGEPGFALVLLNEASAYPHGSKQPQTVREGSVILMDVGCTVHGYQSDISRTWVMGKPTAKQR